MYALVGCLLYGHPHADTHRLTETRQKIWYTITLDIWYLFGVHTNAERLFWKWFFTFGVENFHYVPVPVPVPKVPVPIG